MDTCNCPILHVDMDAFYAAIEQLDNPQLRGRPVIVGSPPNQRGVVSTASYEARRFGVHSAMPSRTAYKKCPHGVFVRVRMERYRAVSAELMRLMRTFTPIVEPLSIDEAFLDVRGVLSRWPGSVELARTLKREIRTQLGLTASVGVAPNKFLAKLASDMQKPDGLTVVPSDPEEIVGFLAPLPACRIWGVGRKAEERLSQAGVRTIGQLQSMERDGITKLLGSTFGYHVWNLAYGRDDRPVIGERQTEKSISNEETFAVDCDDVSVVKQTLVELTEKVGRRLRRAGLRAGVGQVKIRFDDFRTITRQQSFPSPVDNDRSLLACALQLFERENIAGSIRLIGFGVFKLQDDEVPDRQLLLFQPENDPATEQASKLDAAVDELRERYGVDVLKRGRWGT